MSKMKGERKHENKPRSHRDSKGKRFLETENTKEGLGRAVTYCWQGLPPRAGVALYSGGSVSFGQSKPEPVRSECGLWKPHGFFLCRRRSLHLSWQNAQELSYSTSGKSV